VATPATPKAPTVQQLLICRRPSKSQPFTAAALSHGAALASLPRVHGRGLPQVTLKIEMASDGHTATLRLRPT